MEQKNAFFCEKPKVHRSPFLSIFGIFRKIAFFSLFLTFFANFCVTVTKKMKSDTLGGDPRSGKKWGGPPLPGGGVPLLAKPWGRPTFFDEKKGDPVI